MSVELCFSHPWNLDPFACVSDADWGRALRFDIFLLFQRVMKEVEPEHASHAPNASYQNLGTVNIIVLNGDFRPKCELGQGLTEPQGAADSCFLVAGISLARQSFRRSTGPKSQRRSGSCQDFSIGEAPSSPWDCLRSTAYAYAEGRIEFVLWRRWV